MTQRQGWNVHSHDVSKAPLSEARPIDRYAGPTMPMIAKDVVDIGADKDTLSFRYHR